MAIREILLMTACAALVSACGDRNKSESANKMAETQRDDASTQTGDGEETQIAENMADNEDAGMTAPAPTPQTPPMESAMDAPTIEGSYSEGDLSAEWAAWFEEGQLIRVVERQDLGEYGGSEVLIQYGKDGQPVKFTETGERVIVGEGSGEPETLPFAKELYFENGEYTRGHSNQDGREGQPEDREVFAATQLALDARERALEKRVSTE